MSEERMIIVQIYIDKLQIELRLGNGRSLHYSVKKRRRVLHGGNSKCFSLRQNGSTHSRKPLGNAKTGSG